jgi:hypothetical protein
VAWGVPKIGTIATVASGNLTLTEPAGIAQGDLMIADIAIRSTVGFANADWTLLESQLSGDTDATNGIASGEMWACRRGASAPSLVFTRTGGDVGHGLIRAYSGAAGTTLADCRDVETSNTLGAASATATTGTLTTAEDGELIVVMTAAGDNLSASAFDAATDPATASGATDTTTAPTAGTWIERFDAGTNTGADTGLAIADAIRATAGATGTIQATISASARHVMIAAAFKASAGFTGTGSCAAGGLESAGSGSQVFTGTGACAADGLASDGAGTYTPLAITGTGACEAGGAATDGAGTLEFTGTGTGAAGGLASDGTGTHTPPAAENFLDGSGAKPISWWMFEDASSPSLDGNTNDNDLGWFDGSPAKDTTSGKFDEGTASLSVPTSSDAVSRSFANTSANFPFKAATGEFTIGGWVYLIGNAGTQNGFSFSNFSNQGIRIGTAATGKFRTIVYGSSTADLSSNSTIATDGMHHVVVRWNGNNTSGAGANDEVSIWVDGVKQTATATLTSVTLVTASALRFAGSTTGFTNYDEWFAFDVALLDTQIGDIYNSGLAGSQSFTGTGACAAGGLESSGSGTQTFSGTGAAAAGGLATDGSGTYTPVPITGTGTAAAGGLESAGSGTQVFTGAATAAAGGLATDGAGTYTPLAITGTGAAAADGLASAGSGTYTPLAITGSGTAAADGLATAGTGTYTPLAITGTASAAAGGLTTDGTGELLGVFGGTGDAAAGGLETAGTGTYTPQAITGTGAAAAGGLAASGTGTQTFSGTGAAAADGLASDGDGSLDFSGTGSGTFGGMETAGVGALVFAGAGACEAAGLTCDGYDTLTFEGSGDGEIGPVTCAGTGLMSPPATRLNRRTLSPADFADIILGRGRGPRRR